MANVLKMAIVQAILQLHAAKWSQRRIARELNIDRGAVARCLKSLPSDPKPAIPPTGSEGSKPATFESAPAPAVEGSDRSESSGRSSVPKPAIPPAGKSGSADAALPACNHSSPSATAAGRHSDCEPLREIIQAKLDQGLSAQRIYQDLTTDHAATVGYDSVKRYVRRLRANTPLPFRRMECAAGEEAQVDFGTGAPLIDADGKRRKSYVFRIVLSHSRKGYSEATRRQTTEDFFRCLENAFAYFGGVPKTLVIDNLKAAVAHPDWFDPLLTPKVQSFCEHYGTVILPTKPRMPRHKGKIESGVKYVKNNALKGRTFTDVEAENRFLLDWERHIADRRIHGTTKRQVAQVFKEAERPALLPLPRERFPCFQEARRSVHRDGHVEVAKAYYSVPPEYLGHELWVRWDARLVRVFNHRWEQVAIHVRSEPGRFNTNGDHVPAEKISGLERGAGYLLGKVSGVGPQAHQWAQATVTVRGIQGTRVLQGLLALSKKHNSETLEKACETALSYGCFHLKAIRRLVECQADKQQPLPFLNEHPIIRPLDDYAAVVRQAIHRQDSRSSMSEGFLRHGRTKASGDEAQQKSLATPSPASQGLTDLLPSSSGYPSSGCASAEPDSVSPDSSSVVPSSLFHQEKTDA
jgi:transposase